MNKSQLPRFAIVASLFVFGAPALSVNEVWAAADAQPAETKSAPVKRSSPSIAWKKVPVAEQAILAPLESEWSKMPGHQQRKLLGAAKEYPKLSPVEQERFKERLQSWSALTPAQRTAARDKYQSLSSLPPARQQELKARWLQEKSADKTTKQSSDAIVTPAPSTVPTPPSAK